MNRIKLFSIAVLTTGIITAQTETKKDTVQYKERPFQITLFTPIGTNGIESYKVVNKVSINLFAGVSRGVNGFEGGGFLNVDLKDVKGLQLAGFSNVVLGNVKGMQYAGYVNYSGGNLQGAQFAGFCNVNMGYAHGAQFAGFLNVNLDSLKGAQLAGFVNVNLGKVKGAQAAGFINYAQKGITGLQGAGFLNVALNDVKGAQLAGFGNVAGNVEGVQAAGFINVAKKVKGAQIGFINVADSVDGTPIGFCSVVRKGLHQIEVSADEMFYANVSIRTGVHKFYNVFSAGMSPKSGDLLWHIGYGVGTSIRINDKFRSDIMISTQHVSNGLLYHGSSEIYKLYIGGEYKLANKCFIAAGPTFNLYFSDTYLPDYAKTYSSVVPYSVLNETNTYGFNFKAWIGAKVAIRFL